MQKEKHEFENFLQQVTDRLKAMDHFLQNETSNIQQANTLGKQFDKQMGLNVEEIRLHIDQATELSSLKQTVNSKLDTISGHIQHYREAENSRYQQSQDEVDAMHSKMLTLETEAEQLKKLVIEKNRQAMFDALTGIPNRLSYEKKISEEIARWKRFSNPLSLAIWDIDFFKKVNDTYGHKAGDKVLKTVAQLLVKSIRSTDYLARYGGEEFIMLLPGTRQEETLRLVNKLRLQIENCGFHYHGDAVKITVSCGVSSFNENDTLGQVFERADKALYRAKENGRNQCVVASSLSD
jgi:diguanylate cyclase